MHKFLMPCLILVAFSISTSCSKKDTVQQINFSETTIADSAMVVSARQEASRIGLQILKEG